MLNCHDATGLASQAQERKLTLAEKMKLRMHLAMCDGCSAFERQIPLLRKAIRSFASLKQDGDST